MYSFLRNEVLDSLQWNIKWDETHLALYSWEIEYLVSYQFCELWGLKLRERRTDKFIPIGNLCRIRIFCKPINEGFAPVIRIEIMVSFHKF